MEELEMEKYQDMVWHGVTIPCEREEILRVIENEVLTTVGELNLKLLYEFLSQNTYSSIAALNNLNVREMIGNAKNFEIVSINSFYFIEECLKALEGEEDYNERVIRKINLN